jgi:hypothetical protein
MKFRPKNKIKMVKPPFIFAPHVEKKKKYSPLGGHLLGLPLSFTHYVFPTP